MTFIPINDRISGITSKTLASFRGAHTNYSAVDMPDEFAYVCDVDCEDEKLKLRPGHVKTDSGQTASVGSLFGVELGGSKLLAAVVNGSLSLRPLADVVALIMFLSMMLWADVSAGATLYVFPSNKPLNYKELNTNFALLNADSSYATNWIATNALLRVETDAIFTNWLATSAWVQVSLDSVFSTNWIYTNTIYATATNAAVTEALSLAALLYPATNTLTADTTNVLVNGAWKAVAIGGGSSVAETDPVFTNWQTLGLEYAHVYNTYAATRTLWEADKTATRMRAYSGWLSPDDPTNTLIAFEAGGGSGTHYQRIAIGRNARVYNSHPKTAIGYGAIVSGEDAIQLGEGSNGVNNTFQVFDFQVMDADGLLYSDGNVVLTSETDLAFSTWTNSAPGPTNAVLEDGTLVDISDKLGGGGSGSGDYNLAGGTISNGAGAFLGSLTLDGNGVLTNAGSATLPSGIVTTTNNNTFLSLINVISNVYMSYDNTTNYVYLTATGSVGRVFFVWSSNGTETVKYLDMHP